MLKKTSKRGGREEGNNLDHHQRPTGYQPKRTKYFEIIASFPGKGGRRTSVMGMGNWRDR